MSELHLPLGTLVNAATVLVGASLGLLLHRSFPERFRSMQFQATGLFTIALGIQMLPKAQNTILLVFSLLLGGLLGESLRLEERMEKLAAKLKGKPAAGELDSSPASQRFSEGLLSAFLIFCVGPMTIVGALDEGLRGDHSLLLAKAALDGFTSFALAGTYGTGVVFSALPLLIFQYGISLIGILGHGALSETVVAQLTGTGGALMLALGLNLLGVTKLRVMNLLPALLLSLAANLV